MNQYADFKAQSQSKANTSCLSITFVKFCGAGNFSPQFFLQSWIRKLG